MLKLTKTFYKNAQAYVSQQYRYIINQGGSSSSKTFSILQLLTHIAVNNKLTIDIASESVPHLKRGVLRDLPIIFEQMGLNFDLLFNRSDNFIKFSNGSKINLIALDNPGKARGSRRDILFINEANLIPYETALQLFIRTHQTIFIDYNPTNAFWVHNQIIPNNPDKCLLIKSTYKDNQYLPQAEIDELESRKGDNNFWRVYGLGELGKAEGLIFDNVEARTFTAEELKRFDRIFEGIDWGFAVDPFVFIQCYFNRKHHALYIFNEIYGAGITDDKAIIEVRKLHSAGTEIMADREEPKSIYEFQDAGLPIVQAKQGAGSISYGIKKLQSLIKIYIDPQRCPNAYREFIEYAYETDRNGEIKSIYPDKKNHCLTGNTLITTLKGQIPIKDVKIGDYVLTRKGYKKVLWSGISAYNRQVYKLVTQKGYELTGTFNHKIYTNSGFRDIINLRYDDELLITKEYIKWLKEKQSNTIIKYGIDTLNQKEAATETIFKNAVNFYIIMFGKNITAAAKKVIIYIILTVIFLIIQLIIWKKSRLKNTCHCATNGQKNGEKNKKNLLIKSVLLQKNGMLLSKGMNGINCTLKKIILDILNLDLLNAKFAERNLKKIHRIKNFVQILVNRNTDGSKGLIILQSIVNFAEKNLLQINFKAQDFVQDNVQTIICGGIEDKVYDLTIEECHEFFANGILVHNCIDAVRYALENEFSV